MSHPSCFIPLRILTVLPLGGALILGGCAKHAPEAKASAGPSPEAVAQADAAALAQTERQIANDLTLIAALALIQASNALLPATAVVGSGPMAPETNAAPAPQPALTALPATAADGIASAKAEVWPRIILPPEPVAEVTPVVVNNYYVQQVVAPEPVAEFAPAPAQIVVVGGGRIAPVARGTRAPTAAPAASSSAAPTAPLSTGSMVATGLPLNTGSMVARGSGLTSPGTTGLLPPALPTQAQPTQPPAQNPPGRGNRGGQ